MRNFIASLFIATAGLTSMSNFADDNQSPVAGVSNLQTEFVIELKVLIGKAETVGESDVGLRRFIPITGGEFKGKHIQGDVIPGGADWQLQRPDGVTEVKAIYAIKTDDGVVIEVDNRGVVVPPTKPSAHGAPYVRTTPTFKAPKGKYEWLNEKVFVGTITPSAARDFVTIRVFEVQ